MSRSSLVAALVALASAPGWSAEEKLKVAVLDLAAKGSPAEMAASATALVATELDKLGVFRVISGEDIRAMISFEKTRQSLGCEADASCLAEIGGALGVDYIVAGSLGKLGDTYTLFLNLTDIKKAAVESRVQENIEGGESKIIPAIKRGVGQMVGKVLKDREGYLILTVSEEGATVKVDGQVRGVSPMRGRMTLAWGPHLVEVEKQGFVAYSEDVHVPAKQPVAKHVELIPSMDFINAYESSNSKLRLGAWISTAVAVIGVGAAAGLYWSYGNIHDEFVPLQQQLQRGEEDPAVRSRAEQLQTDADGMLLGTRVSLGVGLLSAAAATVFWIAGDDPDRYERFREAEAEPSWRVAFAPTADGGVAALRAEF